MQVKMYIRIVLCVSVNYNIEIFNFWGIENKYFKLTYMRIFNQMNNNDA